MKKILMIIIALIIILVLISVVLINNAKKNSPKKQTPTSCPKYIDCMPGPGKKPCIIPPGCENQTTPLY